MEVESQNPLWKEPNLFARGQCYFGYLRKFVGDLQRRVCGSNDYNLLPDKRLDISVG